MNSSDTFIVENFSIDIKTEEIINSLRKDNKKNNSNQRKPTERIMNEILQQKRIIDDLIHPKGLYKLIESEFLEPSYLFKQSEKTILAICTIGNSIENKIDDLIKLEKLSSAVILDTIASLAAEEVASELNRIVTHRIATNFKNLDFTNRFSPGYCNWPMSGQNMIFSILKPEQIDIILTDSMMMLPRKSVSFAINIGSNIDKTLGKRECRYCKISNCTFRRNGI